MNSSVSDPTTLTKDKLKKELSKLGIALPTAEARKDIYVDLYRKHILNQTSEFSADESESPKLRKKKPGSPRKSLSKKSSIMQGNDVDVNALSDKELADMLRGFGEDIGPILASTRRVYQKKLQKLIDAGGSVQQEEDTQQSTPDTVDIDELQFSDSDPEEIPIVPPPAVIQERESVRRRQTRSSPPKQAPPPSSPRSRRQPAPPPSPPRHPLARKPLPDRPASASFRSRSDDQLDGNSSTTKTTTTTYTRTDTAAPSKPAAAPSKPAAAPSKPDTAGAAGVATKKKGGVSIWLQIGLFIVVALVIFFVIHNMEPAGADPIKGLEG